MRLKQLENQWRVWMHPDEYKQLRSCAESRRAHIAIRLGGECGLRVGETASFKLDQVRETTVDIVDEAYMLQVFGKDTLSKHEDGKFREAFIPLSLYREIEKHAAENDIAPDEEIIPVTKRTTQEYIKRAALTCADRYGNEHFEKVSSHDLRAFWASDLLIRRKVDENVVMALGGWVSRETMEVYLNAMFDDIVLEEMVNAGLAQPATA